MKVYITTHHNVENFGAALQSYGLQSFLKKQGYENELINCKNNSFVRSGGASYKRALSTMINVAYNKVHSKAIKQGENRFKDFFESYHKTTKKYDNFEELRKDPPVGDVYISGSDQVFNVGDMSEMFFLQFGSKETKRISYAASVGISDIPDSKKERFKQYLQDFDHLSIRESYSKKLVSEYTDKNISVNIDPSYLLSKEEWAEMSNDEIADTIKKPYVLVYAIYKPEWINSVLKRIKKETNCEIVIVKNKGYRPIFCDRCIMNAGPREFLGLVKNAEMVVSSSYHGNVFSSIFEKPFYAMVNPSAPARIMSMLELFGLENRVLEKDTQIDLNIDYENMNAVLKEERQAAKEYLTVSIEGERKI